MNRTIRHAIRFIAVFLLAILAPGQVTLSGAVEAQTQTLAPAQQTGQDTLGGKTLMTFCAGGTDVDSGLCNGYILGIAEAMSAGQPVYGARACNHDGIRAQQLADLVRMDIGSNPALENQKAGPMVAGILAKEFPCYDDYAPAAGGNRDVSERKYPR